MEVARKVRENEGRDRERSEDQGWTRNTKKMLIKTESLGESFKQQVFSKLAGNEYPVYCRLLKGSSLNVRTLDP